MFFVEQVSVTRRLSDSNASVASAMPVKWQDKVQVTPQQPASPKLSTVKSVDRANTNPSTDTASAAPKPFLHPKKYTDGSVSWDKLPEGLASLGKV
jgi:hypothetical protein